MNEIYDFPSGKYNCDGGRLEWVYIYIYIYSSSAWFRDSVNREALWTVLVKFGCPEKFVNNIKALYTGSTARVQSSGLTSEEFEILTGVKQGCVLAPTLFPINLTAVIKMAFDGGDGVIQFDYRLDGRLFNRSRFNAKSLVHQTAVKMLMFADDCRAGHVWGRTTSSDYGLRYYSGWVWIGDQHCQNVLFFRLSSRIIRAPQISRFGIKLSALVATFATSAVHSQKTYR